MAEDSVGGVFRQVAAHAARYRDGIATAMHRPEQGPAQAMASFRADLPKAGTAGETVIDDLVRLAGPGLIAMTGPRFFGWVIGGSHPVGVAADWLTSAWGQNAGNHHATPAAAAAEAVAAGWLLELLDLPRDASVGFVTGATMASGVGLAAARGEVLRRAGWDVEAMGLFGAPEIAVAIGNDAHASVFWALQFIGLGHDRVIRVATDSQGRIDPADFARKIAVRRPVIAVLQAGQLNTGAFDAFQTLIPLAHAAGAWVHVDGAFGLWARASPAHKALAAGVELADSWATDGHKWLQTPYDCGYVICRDADAHRRAMTIAASYLPATAEGERDPTHYVPELSRRARGFATWAMIRHFGRDGIAEMVAGHCEVAAGIARRLRQADGIAVLNDVVLNQVLVRFGADSDPETGDRFTAATIARLQADGTIYAGGALWRGRRVMRLSVSNYATDAAEGETAAAAILAAWEAVRGQAA